MKLELFALAVFVAALTSLFVLFPCQEIGIAQAPAHVGECVRICGTVVQRYATEKACFYTLFNGDTIKAVQFRPYTCLSGEICVLGRVQMYRGEYEVVILSYD